MIIIDFYIESYIESGIFVRCFIYWQSIQVTILSPALAKRSQMHKVYVYQVIEGCRYANIVSIL